jgi:hypothetical protein
MLGLRRLYCQTWARGSVVVNGGYYVDQAAFQRGGPGSNPGLVMWDFVMDKSGAGTGTMLQAGRSRVRVPMRWIFLN